MEDRNIKGPSKIGASKALRETEQTNDNISLLPVKGNIKRSLR